MRQNVLFALLPLLLIACRTTHDADSGEMANLNQIANTIAAGDSASTDMGDGAISSVWTVYPVFEAMNDKDTRSSSNAIVGSDLDVFGPDDIAVLGWKRTAWPDCVTEDTSSYTYDACEYLTAGSTASVDFLLDGSISWTDSSYNASLLFDLSISAVGIGVGTSFEWAAQSAWTDTTFDGDFSFDFAAGASLNSTTIPFGATILELDATFETLTWDSACADGPVSGIIDWKAMLRQGRDTDRSHVTIEFLDCGQATITW